MLAEGFHSGSVNHSAMNNSVFNNTNIYIYIYSSHLKVCDILMFSSILHKCSGFKSLGMLEYINSGGMMTQKLVLVPHSQPPICTRLCPVKPTVG